MKNWKTTLTGFGLILVGVGVILTNKTNDGSITALASALILGGLGLAGAKDNNK